MSSLEREKLKGQVCEGLQLGKPHVWGAVGEASVPGDNLKGVPPRPQ